MLKDVLPFLVIGLTTGAVYGLAGVGLVLTYKVSGIFNFAHGALAAVAAYSFYSLHIQAGLPWPVAAAISVLVIGPLLGLGLERLGALLEGRSLALQVACTVGLLLVIEAAIVLVYGTLRVRRVPVFLAEGHVIVLGTAVQIAEIVTFAVALLATATLATAFHLTRRGIAMRAVVDNPELLGLTGTSPTATRRAGWVIGSTFAAGSGVLLAPLIPLDPVGLTLLVVAAFGAAAIGSFTDLPLTFTGGLLIGVLASLSTVWFPTGILSGLAPGLPFLVLFSVLLFFPKRRLAGHQFLVPRSRPTWTAPRRLQIGGSLVLLAALATVPLFAGVHQTAWTVGVATVIVFLSLSLLVRTSGQVSLGHVAFTAIGAAAFSHLALDNHVPWLAALMLAALAAVPVGAVLAIPAVRLSGLFLALATFGFAVLLQQSFYTQPFMFGANARGLNEPRPAVLGLDRDIPFYYLVLAIAAGVTVVVLALDRTRLGRLLRAMADSPRILETSGADTRVSHVIAFCLSAFLAALGGALVGAAQTVVIAESFPPLLSLNYFALAMIVWGRAPWDAILAGLGLVVFPAYMPSTELATTVLQLVFGGSAILIAVGPPHRLPGAIRDRIDSLFGVRRAAALAVSAAPTPRLGTPAQRRLTLDGITVRYGGLVAVDGLSLEVSTGFVVGLIGPNGAGKTSAFNVCSGLLRPASGRVLIDGTNVTRLGPAARAQHGLGRTFQRMELFDSLTVAENVAIGVEAGLAGANPIAHLLGRPASREDTGERVADALATCGITALGATPVAELSTGQRRLVDLARTLAGRFRILLLDEPSSGLDLVETKRLGAILKAVVGGRGVGVLLVEHDMSLVLDICSQVHVLDFGKKVFEGTPSEVRRSDIVRAVYLGDEFAEPGDRRRAVATL